MVLFIAIHEGKLLQLRKEGVKRIERRSRRVGDTVCPNDFQDAQVREAGDDHNRVKVDVMALKLERNQVVCRDSVECVITKRLKDVCSITKRLQDTCSIIVHLPYIVGNILKLIA